ncbi:uncharacterized protein UV8b_03127 [Ustilaginoidea virens]|uniref:Oligopeptide transporter n=1 Tax=Ustilaginoidea virens TaxID=1159556 RepID=A0A8E5MGI4_USTVR|nr:uncharacterized protein UV8b_03127 [Ustilaginoidea virens]QUC18886.1 hypothetical protein UV8b_03127 [Ustilaginoidea virens]
MDETPANTTVPQPQPVSGETKTLEPTTPNSHHGDIAILNQGYEGKPTDEEFKNLRRVPVQIPTIAYLLCIVEFCERASYIGCAQVWTNYINRPLPKGGNGYGAVAGGSQATQGALGMGEQIANATTQSFSLLAYSLPLLFGHLGDTRFGRFPMIFWGVITSGVGHAFIVAGGAKQLLDNGTAKIPFFIGVYILAVGAAMFKPVLSPLILDQMQSHVPVVKILESGERVIEDPEHGSERVMLWFYLMTNVGGLMSTATSYSARYVGWWLAFLLPLLLYLPLPLLLLWLKPRLKLRKPGGSDLPNTFRVIGHGLADGGVFRIGRSGWWENAKPSSRARKGLPPEDHYPDEFVVDVQRTLQAASMFFFFPVQYWNSTGFGSASNFLGTMLTGNGVPNDVVGNFNCVSVIVFGFALNYAVYPLLRKARIRYGPVSRLTTGFFLSTLAGVGNTVLCYKAYQTSPCGWYGSSDAKCVNEGLMSPISLWWQVIPYALGGLSELFIDVPSYSIAYSRSPENMRGLLQALSLFAIGFAEIANLLCSSVVVDPYLIRAFGVPAVVGVFVTVGFWLMFRHIDKEEFVLSTTQTSEAEKAGIAARSEVAEGGGSCYGPARPAGLREERKGQ